MAVHVAVVDPLPLFQKGVAAVLSAVGYTVEEPADVLAWTKRTSTAVVLLTLGAEGDWRLLDRLHEDDSPAAVIALIDNVTAAMATRAIRAGAHSVLPRQATASALRRTVEATLDGQAVLPSAIAAAIVAGGPADEGRAVLSEQQLSWLRRLAAGATVAQLADDAGYSERAMYRMLQGLYTQMGVDGRLHAIMQAQARGWLQ